VIHRDLPQRSSLPTEAPIPFNELAQVRFDDHFEETGICNELVHPNEIESWFEPLDLTSSGNEYEPVEIDESPIFREFPSVEHEPYRLKVGDTFIVSVYGEEKTDREVVVDPRGMISYLFIDSHPAVGKTIAEIREELGERLRKYYRHVILAITPIKFSAEYYTVTGQVVDPGKQPLVGNPTALSALCQAQGFTYIDYRDQLIDMCDLDRTFLARNGQYVPVDFNKLVRHGDLGQDQPLEAGDFIYVPGRSVKQVFVVGEVLNPHSIEYFSDISLVEAIAEAGDVTERASSRVVVLRGSLCCPTRYLIDYSRIVKGCYPDFRLLPGDIVFVPPRKLYLVKEFFRIAVAAFISTVAYETGIEMFIRSHPHAATDLGNRDFVPGGVIIP
jgi:polysaccharide export outer membrane protein